MRVRDFKLRQIIKFFGLLSCLSQTSYSNEPFMTSVYNSRCRKSFNYR